ncbi:hypothetical protein HanRHA438_Chr04g0154441 [Helianthus annuus]|uniref:Uncharacterized protein n=1 Tax=Helianthus annuus TaxID=4232 RepID=A0A251UV56_HELAN|nr:hypothetical protein HanXRQr2_Chr04g0142781 [Helianthus annuus]KAJ0579486.1 hypothetical protein HanHA300_Chr04g0118471 [Helianthus annuus]KAJ0586675.1 hypothetical protein HanIR_Chr04g0154501 [Helianthus annuus]KAJ0595385.1 hypothetical protein HanHA89_Chr04g0130801 [Helianthus annuus]KAJ0756056.1 hypothetical protein HanLR1_Chr04g0122751 [Helianthus annuus]
MHQLHTSTVFIHGIGRGIGVNLLDLQPSSSWNIYFFSSNLASQGLYLRWRFIDDASTSGAGDLAKDEEMLLPTLEGKIDPANLAFLPPSMQLDLLVQMRERLVAVNRKKY